MSKKKVTKYRISLPPDIISHLISLAKKDSSTLSIEALKILIPVQAKIDADILKPSYITNPKPDLFEQLGFESFESPDIFIPKPFYDYTPNRSPIDPNAFATKEDYWEACYKKYKLYLPNCSIREIEAAKEHMYLNGLMTPEEIKEFESNM